MEFVVTSPTNSIDSSGLPLAAKISAARIGPFESMELTEELTYQIATGSLGLL